MLNLNLHKPTSSIRTIRRSASIGQVTDLADGLASDAYPERARVKRISSSNDLPLKPNEKLRFDALPDWGRLWSITLEDEARFPGTYRMHDSERLSDTEKRAGGLTDEAFPDGPVLLRESLRTRQLASSEAAGELIIDFADRDIESWGLEIRDGDHLLVPKAS